MAPPDVVCLSHLPWAFGLERPHQVMRRFARDRHVFFVEEPVAAGAELRTVMRTVEPNVHVVSLQLPADTSLAEIEVAHRLCVAALARDTERPLLWVYAPTSLPAARDLDPSLIVYDCVADHAARQGARPDETKNEADLLMRADLVLTAGTSLFEAKRACNVSTYPLPSSVDAEHFADATPASRRELGELAARGPRVGFLGPIDDRVDLGLVDQLAAARPDVQIVLVGGLVGVTTWDLPDRPNVQWLGAKDYAELPKHVTSWDVAIVPFRSDAATKRTEPSGLLACLAAGKPVVSTPLDELVTFAERGVVSMAAASDFVAAVDGALAGTRDPVVSALRTIAGDGLLARTSWDKTFSAMVRLVDEAAMGRAVAARRRDRESDRLLRSA
jgi:glycosyltransferase involved in cell wall biosynthesis